MKAIEDYGSKNSSGILFPSKKLFENLIWLNTKEASTYLRLSPNGLRSMVSRGQIVAYKLGNRLRFKRSELNQLLESSTTKEFL